MYSPIHEQLCTPRVISNTETQCPEHHGESVNPAQSTETRAPLPQAYTMDQCEGNTNASLYANTIRFGENSMDIAVSAIAVDTFSPVDTDSEPPLESGLCGRCMRSTVYRCAKCRRAFYCSRACQRACWTRHRGECGRYKTLSVAAIEAAQTLTHTIKNGVEAQLPILRTSQHSNKEEEAKSSSSFHFGFKFDETTASGDSSTEYADGSQILQCQPCSSSMGAKESSANWSNSNCAVVADSSHSHDAKQLAASLGVSVEADSAHAAAFLVTGTRLGSATVLSPNLNNSPDIALDSISSTCTDFQGSMDNMPPPYSKLPVISCQSQSVVGTTGAPLNPSAQSIRGRPMYRLGTEDGRPGVNTEEKLPTQKKQQSPPKLLSQPQSRPSFVVGGVTLAADARTHNRSRTDSTGSSNRSRSSDWDQVATALNTNHASNAPSSSSGYDDAGTYNCRYPQLLPSPSNPSTKSTTAYPSDHTLQKSPEPVDETERDSVFSSLCDLLVEALGVDMAQARLALATCNGDSNRAAEWIMLGGNRSGSSTYQGGSCDSQLDIID